MYFTTIVIVTPCVLHACVKIKPACSHLLCTGVQEQSKPVLDIKVPGKAQGNQIATLRVVRQCGKKYLSSRLNKPQTLCVESIQNQCADIHSDSILFLIMIKSRPGFGTCWELLLVVRPTWYNTTNQDHHTTRQEWAQKFGAGQPI